MVAAPDVKSDVTGTASATAPVAPPPLATASVKPAKVPPPLTINN
jgi:hypothetical protein